jgi:hypothetical protein
MGLPRLVMILEAALLAVCGFLCLALPAFLVATGIAYARHGFSGPLFWWSAATVLSLLAIVLLLSRARAARANVPPALTVLPALDADDPLFEKKLKLHEAKMKYAWNWFQYHADQRLKGFNFFVVALGILLAAYGAAIKESVTERITDASTAGSYQALAVGIGFCGAIISIAFLLIEVRNRELVECALKWLESLEDELRMSLRKDDHQRVCLPKAVGVLTGSVAPFEFIITHAFWIRIIYGMSAAGFIVAVFFAIRGFG